jgi:uncharacterized protein (TIGR00255 family)
MICSMTAFASLSGAARGHQWTWDLRSVNARGLDLRLRLPDGLPGLEATVRAALTARIVRGAVTLNLRLVRSDPAAALTLDEAHLERVLAALARITESARVAGLGLAPPAATDILAIRGVVPAAAPEPDEAMAEDSLLNALKADLDAVLEDFIRMRRAEGAALADLLALHLDRIEAQVTEARAIAIARQREARAALGTALRRVFEEVPEMDETRLAQELALIAVRTDVTEEIDRLSAHVAAARTLLHGPGPQGRKLDFLAQEFNREANTLCSKAQSAELTRIGLELKAAIDQMREQIQNVE